MTKRQESHRKGVERLFGVLQVRFHILRAGIYVWSDTEIVGIVQTCVILHIMLTRMSMSGDLHERVSKYAPTIGLF